MNFSSVQINSVKEVSVISGQQNIEADIVLPDYYDTIGKIIKCTVEPMIEAVNIAGEKISISGTAKLSLLYASENKKIFSYENDYKYTKVFQTKFSENNVCSNIRQNVFSLNYRAIGPKRIEMRSVLQITGKVHALEKTMLLSDTDEAEIITKKDSAEILETVLISTKDFSLSKADAFSSVNEDLSDIVRKSCSIRFSEIKPIHNKVYVKGFFETGIYYIPENSVTVKKAETNIPFSEIIDLFGTEENDICNISSENIYCEISLPDSDNKKSAEIRVTAFLDITVYRKSTKNFIADAYSLKSYLVPEKISLDGVTNEYIASKKESISFDADMFDDNAVTVCDAYIENFRITTEKKSDRAVSLITADFSAVVMDSFNTIYVISREYTFESQLTINSSDWKTGNTSVEVLSISALQNSNGKITFSADMNINTHICELCKVKGFTDFSLTECNTDDAKEKFIIYFACKDEELWTIAKENMTCVEAIKKANNITTDKITENMTILLPSF